MRSPCRPGSQAAQVKRAVASVNATFSEVAPHGTVSCLSCCIINCLARALGGCPVSELGGVAAGGRVEALACERLGLGEAW